jgi:hypothetical protein
MRGFLRAHQDLVDHLLQLHLLKHLFVKTMVAQPATNVNQQPTVHTQM